MRHTNVLRAKSGFKNPVFTLTFLSIPITSSTSLENKKARLNGQTGYTQQVCYMLAAPTLHETVILKVGTVLNFRIESYRLLRAAELSFHHTSWWGGPLALRPALSDRLPFSATYSKNVEHYILMRKFSLELSNKTIPDA